MTEEFLTVQAKAGCPFCGERDELQIVGGEADLVRHKGDAEEQAELVSFSGLFETDHRYETASS